MNHHGLRLAGFLVDFDYGVRRESGRSIWKLSERFVLLKRPRRCGDLRTTAVYDGSNDCTLDGATR